MLNFVRWIYIWMKGHLDTNLCLSNGIPGREAWGVLGPLGRGVLAPLVGSM